MRLTPKQQDVLNKTLDYSGWLIWQPSDTAVEHFFAFIDRGIEMPKDCWEQWELLSSWKSWQPGRAREFCFQWQQWLEGHFEGMISLGEIEREWQREIAVYNRGHYVLKDIVQLRGILRG